MPCRALLSLWGLKYNPFFIRILSYLSNVIRSLYPGLPVIVLSMGLRDSPLCWRWSILTSSWLQELSGEHQNKNDNYLWMIKGLKWLRLKILWEKLKLWRSYYAVMSTLGQSVNKKGIKNFLGISYNPWNISIKNIYLCKSELRKVKHLFLFDNVFHSIQHIE